MKLLKLEGENFKQFKKLGPIYFPDKGIIGITGLNGSGKTTIFHAIEMALFGQVSGVRMSEIRNKDVGNNRWIVSLTFVFNGIQYRVERHETTANSVLYANGDLIQTGQTAVSDHIENNVLRMDHQSFLNAFYAKQDELDKLSELRDGERKNLLSKLLNIDDIDKALQASRKDKNKLDIQIKEMKRHIKDAKVLVDSKEAKEKKRKDIKKILQKNKEEIKEVEIKREKLKKVNEILSKEKEIYNRLVNQIKNTKERIKNQSKLSNRLAKDVDELGKVQKKLKGMPTILSAIPEKQKFVNEQEEIHNSDAERKRIENRIKHQKDKVTALEKDLKGEDLNRLQEGLDSITKAVEDLTKTIQDLNIEIYGYSTESERIKADGKLIRKQINEMKELDKKSDCPTCEQELSTDHIRLVIQKYKAELKVLSDKYRSNENKLKSSKKLLSQQQNQLKNLKKRKNKGQIYIEKVTKIYNKISSEKNVLKGFQEDLETWKNNNKNTHLKMITKTELEEKKKELKKLQEKEAFYNANKNRVESLPDLYRELDAVNKEINVLNKEMKIAEENKKELNFNPKALKENEKEIENVTKNIELLKEYRTEKTIELARVEQELKRISSDIKENSKQTIELEERTEKFTNLLYLDSVFQSFKIEKLAEISPAISNSMSNLLSFLTDGKYDAVELDKDYNVFVYRHGVRQPQRMFSGGEKKLISFAQRLAISQIITQQRQTSVFEFLALDEIVGSLDENRRFVVLDSLNRLNDMFKQIFMITHNEELNISFDYNLNITTDIEGFSNASWAEEPELESVKKSVII